MNWMEKIITEFVALRPKIYSYLLDHGKSDKKAKVANVSFKE